jgi:hypothetical protein
MKCNRAESEDLFRASLSRTLTGRGGLSSLPKGIPARLPARHRRVHQLVLLELNCRNKAGHPL